MAYEANFYIPANIIGYTGDARHHPTIYYQQGHRFGRITTRHMLPFNVGRDYVRYNPTYVVDNQHRSGRLVAVETIIDRNRIIEIHRSRNAMVPRHAFRPGDLQYLIGWALMFPAAKTVYQGATSEMQANRQHDQADVQMDLKAQMQAEMKARFALAARQNANPNRRGGVRLDNAQRVIGGAQGRTWG